MSPKKNQNTFYQVSLTSEDWVAEWITTSTRKAKVPGLSPDASYVQKEALCSNRRANT